MEEDAGKNVALKKSAVKEVGVIKLDEFDDNDPNEDEYDNTNDLEMEYWREPEYLHEPEYDNTSVFLSWYDSDLNLVIDETNFTVASPLSKTGFGLVPAGARATFGYISGKVCFEVKVLQNCKLMIQKGFIRPHVLRVGWSSLKSCLQLGTEEKSYGYDNYGRIYTNGDFKDYGVKFEVGNVIGAFLEIDDESVTLSFTVNGEDQGIAYQIPQSYIQKEALFPHVLTKNISYECNFRGEKPWFAPKEGFTFVGDVPLADRISGPKQPKSKSDCEVIMMCGLPKSGKTDWVNDLREKNPGKYYVLDTRTLIDKEELEDPVCKEVIRRKTKLIGKILAMAMDRKRNYILDQMNLVRHEQIWKLKFFIGFKCKIVVIVLPDEEYKKRIQPLEERLEDLAWLYQLKAKFMLPVMQSQLCKIVDEITFAALPEHQALKLVIRYRREAWLLGYKPLKKYFMLPGHILKSIKQAKKRGVSKPGGKNFPGSAVPFRNQTTALKIPELLSVPQKQINQSWSSPPVKRASEEWHVPPRQRMNEDWASPPRKRKETWPSPSRKKGNELRQSPPRNRSGSNRRSPLRGRHDNWSQERRRKVSESPPRFRPAGRRETPPRSRKEEWQSRGPKTHVEHTSLPRRRPSDSVRRANSRSPPRDRIDPHNSERKRFQEREGGGYRHQHDSRVDRGLIPRRTAMNEDWPTYMADKFPPRGQNMENIHEQEGRMGGGPPPHGNKAGSGVMDDDDPRKSREQAGRGALPHRRHGVSSGLSPQGTRMGGGFPPGDAQMDRGYPSSRMDKELLPQERRFGGMPSHEERFVGVMRGQDNRLESGLLPVENRRNEGFFQQEGRVPDHFPPQDIRVLMSNQPSEGRAVGMVHPLEGHEGRGYSPYGQIGNDHPRPGGIPARSQMVRGLPPHERRPDIRLPEARGSARNVSPESIMVIDIHPREGRSIELVPSDRIRGAADYPLQRGRGNENLPEHDGERARMLPPENRMIERIVDDLPPQRMSGDLPTSEGRMGGNFNPGARLGGNMPPRGERPFASHEIPLRDASPPHDHDLPSHNRRMTGDFSPRDGRMVGDFPPRDGRMMGDFPPHDGRLMGDFPPRDGRMMGDFQPHDGRMAVDIPPRDGRMMGNFPPHEERMDNFAPHEGRNVGDFPSTDGRSGGNTMVYEKPSGDFPLRGGRFGGGEMRPPHGHMGDMNFPPGGRGDMGDVSHHRGDTHPPGGRNDAEFPRQGRIGYNMVPPGRMGSSDFPPDGRIGMLPQAERISGEPVHRREQFGCGGTFQGGRPVVDHPPRARFGGDLPPHEMRMGNQQHLEGRSGPDEHWNRLPSNPDQINFGLPTKQELLNEDEFIEHKGGDDDRNQSWGQRNRSKSDHSSNFQPSFKQESINKLDFRPQIKQKPLNTSGFRNEEPDIHHNQWNSQDVQHQSFQSGGNYHGPGPSYSFNEDREGGGRGQRAWKPEEPSNSGWNSKDSHAPDRLPTNTDRGRPHSSTQKQPSFVGPNIQYQDGEDEEHDPRGWEKKPSQRGAADKKRDPVGRDSHNYLHEEDDEGLAPYEQPFNQSVWDSNEPDVVLFPQGSDDCAGRTRDSGRSRPQDPGSHSANKPGSVWQRVGGYVDDDDDEFSSSQHFGKQNRSGDHFGCNKERSYEDGSGRRGHDVRKSRERQHNFSSHRSDEVFSRGGSRGMWGDTEKKQMGRW